MPLPKRVEGGYRGVDVRTTERLGFAVVRMSHNVHRFNTMAEAHAFVDEMIARERAIPATDYYRRAA